jgi:hypothetical protein
MPLSAVNFWNAWISLFSVICCSAFLAEKTMEELEKECTAEILPVKIDENDTRINKSIYHNK